MFARKSWQSFVIALEDTVRPPIVVRAHCDIPCGIYDPHEAQIAALTVLRMDQLIGDLAPPPMDAKPEDRASYVSKLARFTAIKEASAERVKSELRVIWGDYFTPDHLKQYPTLHETFFQAMKHASKARQSTNIADAQALLGAVQALSEIFWKTKGATTRRLPSLQKSGGEIVYPVPAA
jgi:nickel superoxide dismutase